MRHLLKFFRRLAHRQPSVAQLAQVDRHVHEQYRRTRLGI